MKSASYGWIIDKDHHPDTSSPEGTNANAKGVTGPHNISDNILNQLLGGGGRTFRMKDGDDETLYTGRIIVPVGEEEGLLDFKPLDDFGTGNGCATSIHYQRGDGTWYEL
jgi:hypothetical protein